MKKEEPEGPPARRKPKPPATVGPSGSGAPSNLSQPSWFPGRSALSLGFGASRASPPAQLVSCPNRTSRCAQSALRLSQGSRPRFPDSAAPAARSEAKCTGGHRAGQPDERAGQRAYAQVERVTKRVTRTWLDRVGFATGNSTALRCRAFGATTSRTSFVVLRRATVVTCSARVVSDGTRRQTSRDRPSNSSRYTESMPAAVASHEKRSERATPASPIRAR